jgi:PadR family transcriptional regulator, regulatory protein PadR
VRKTRTLRKTAAAIMANPASRHWGYDLWKRSGVRSGALYPVLRRMLEEGWLTDGWEQPGQNGRPARRYYELTDAGKAAMTDLLATERTQR